MKAILTIGISASGKSYWADRQPGFTTVSRDDYRWQIMEEKNLEPCWKNWKWKWEDEVTKMVDVDLKLYAQNKQNIIIADTNLNEVHRDAMVKKLESLGYQVDFKVFEIDYDEAVRRDTARPNGVGASVIQKQYQQFLDLFGGARYCKPEFGMKAAIVDIDGTAAIMTDRGPFDWMKVDRDQVNQPIIDIVKGLGKGLGKAGYHILFTSGRSDECRDLTLDWLYDALANDWLENDHFSLLMRKKGDQRKDTIVKREIFDEHIADKYDVQVVLDDRPCVCRMWRDLGLNVVQVGNPYIEF